MRGKGDSEKYGNAQNRWSMKDRVEIHTKAGKQDKSQVQRVCASHAKDFELYPKSKMQTLPQLSSLPRLLFLKGHLLSVLISRNEKRL